MPTTLNRRAFDNKKAYDRKVKWLKSKGFQRSFYGEKWSNGLMDVSADAIRKAELKTLKKVVLQHNNA